jgi:hypothetical protein
MLQHVPPPQLRGGAVAAFALVKAAGAADVIQASADAGEGGVAGLGGPARVG